MRVEEVLYPNSRCVEGRIARVSGSSNGQVVLLNGVSSSGKTTIARQLLDDFETPWFHMAGDMFGAMRSERRTHELDAADIAAVLRRTRAGFHRAVAGMVKVGNNIVMDHVLSEPWRLQDMLAVMDGIDVVFVGVHCSAEALRRREQLRGDRPMGTAINQVAATHAHNTYDVEVDTSTTTVEACSATIKTFVQHNPASADRAFHRLRMATQAHRNIS